MQILQIPTCIACDAGCGSSSSFGAVFFMIFLIASAVYIICGFLINILHFKLILFEAFPNRAFWTYFIGLVQDGVAFTFMVITCRQQQTQYDSFGSTSKGENVYTNADLSSSGNPYDDAGNDQTLWVVLPLDLAHSITRGLLYLLLWLLYLLLLS